MTEIFNLYQDSLNSLLNKSNKLLDNTQLLTANEIDVALYDTDKNLKEAERCVTYLKI